MSFILFCCKKYLFNNRLDLLNALCVLSVCSPICDNGLSPGSREAPLFWPVLLSHRSLVNERRGVLQIWILVTAGWPAELWPTKTNNHIHNKKTLQHRSPCARYMYLNFKTYWHTERQKEKDKRFTDNFLFAVKHTLECVAETYDDLCYADHQS